MFTPNTTGLGFLRPFATLSFLFVLLSFGSVQDLHAQIDINIDVIRLASSSTPVVVSPNPVSSFAKVEHDSETDLYSLTILNASGEVLASLDLTQSSSFDVQLPAGLTHWVFQTSAGVISEPVLISG